MTQQPDDYTPRQRSNVPPNTAYDPTQPYAPQQPQQYPQGWYQPYQAPQPPKKSHKVRNVILGIVGAFIALIVIAAVASGGKTPSSTAAAGTSSSPSQASDTTTDPGADDTTQAAEKVATVPAQVTYKCTGSAPDGVDITYGPSGSQYSAHKLPFSKTATLDPGAEYYALEAQLQGSGSVSCATTVQTADGTKTVSTSSAEGDYNIADTEVCQSYDSTWDSCS